MAPVEVLRARPAGSEPALTDQVNVVCPPVSVAVGDTWVMAVPDTVDFVAATDTATVLVMVQAMAAVPKNEEASVALMVTEHEHGVVGVPLMAPVDVFIVTPTGNAPALIDQVKEVILESESTADGET